MGRPLLDLPSRNAFASPSSPVLTSHIPISNWKYKNAEKLNICTTAPIHCHKFKLSLKYFKSAVLWKQSPIYLLKWLVDVHQAGAASLHAATNILD